jgi:predicted nucleic acid-binding protein
VKREVFVDTGYWIAAIDPTDNLHQVADAQDKQLAETPRITTDEVLAEVLTYFRRHPVTRARAVQAVELILNSEEIEVVPQTRESFMRGLALYKERDDKTYTLTDCISMSLMKARGLHEALSGDHHFEQERFVALLRRA